MYIILQHLMYKKDFLRHTDPRLMNFFFLIDIKTSEFCHLITNKIYIHTDYTRELMSQNLLNFINTPK